MSKDPKSFADAALPFLLDEAEPIPLPKGKTPSYIADHRQRLPARFRARGAAELPDYELLELVLFRAILRRDVKPLAHTLMDHFGDFNRVITAWPAPASFISMCCPVGMHCWTVATPP